jgi:predicted transcriptional regulator of viral defense system
MCNTYSLRQGFTHMSRKPDYDQLYDIAENQGGFFKASQAKKLGFAWDRLSKNVKSGRFTRVAHGVYRLTQFPYTPYEDLFVAWLRTGPDSVISHDSALSVYDITDVLPHEIHVIIPRTASRRRKGIRLHTNQLEEGDVTNREGLPITTVARTLADVSTAGLASEQVKLGIRQAVQRGMVTMKMLWDHAKRRGGRFKKILAEYEKEGER